MIKNKLKYNVPQGIRKEQLSSIQNKICELCDDGMLEDCKCNQIQVFVSYFSPLESHFSARFECDCGKERVEINNWLID